MASNNELNVRNKGIVHTSAEWTDSSNSNYKGNIPINKGELAFTENDGIVTDIKIGDGSNTWGNIPYYLIIPNIKPIIEKTYTGVVCSANTDPAGYLYFGAILPDSYTKFYEITYKITVTMGGSVESNTSYVKYTGIRNSICTWTVHNTITNGSYRAFYNHVIYRAKEAGITGNYGHILGLRFYSSWNPNVSTNARTVKVEIMNMVNCSFSIYDSMMLYANITGNGTTNYEGRSEIDGTSNGFKSSGDNNDVYTMVQNNTRLTAGTNGLMQYSLCMMDSDGKWQSFTTNSGTGTKTKNTAKFNLGQIFYLSMSGNITSGNIIGTSVVRTYQTAIDLRYSTNCGTTLTANKMVYIVGTIKNGLFELDSTWYTQTLPTTPNGKVYVPVGMALDTYRIDFFGYKGAFYHNGTSIASLVLPPLTEEFTGTGTKTLISTNGSELKWRGVRSTGNIVAGDSGSAFLIDAGSVYSSLTAQVISEEYNPSETVTANWDFKNNNPSTMSSVNIQGTNATGTILSDVSASNSDLKLTVNASESGANIKLQYNSSGYAQFNAKTRIQVPVRTNTDVITVVSYPGQHSYTVGGTAAASDTVNYSVTSTDVAAGHVDIIATGTSYLYSIKLVTVATGDNWFDLTFLKSTTGLLRLLHKNNFQISQSATETKLKLAGNGDKGILRLYNGNYYGDLIPASLNANRTWTLPDSSGTIATQDYVNNYVKDGLLTLKVGTTQIGTFSSNQATSPTWTISKTHITNLGIEATDEKVKFNNHDSGWAKVALVANNVSDNLITTALFTKALSMTHITDNNKTDVYLQIGAHEESGGTVSYHRSAIIRMYGLSSHYVDFRIRNGELSGNYYVDDIGKVLIAPTSDSTNGNGDGTYYFAFPKTKTTSPNIINYNDSVNVNISTGTTSVNGYDTLNLGNNIRNGVAGNKIGHIRLYGKGPSSGENNTAGYIDVSNANQTNNNAYSQKLYPKSGNIALIDPDLVVVSKPSVTGVTMNTVATYGNSMGMVNLTAQSSDTNHAIHPAVDTSNWHHYLQMSYIIDNATSNMWQTQIMTKAGTTDLWIRSRSGGPISDDTVWNAGWTRILTGTNWRTALSAPDSNTTKYLRADGTWVVPPNDNTTYTYFLANTGSTTKATSNITNPYLILRDNSSNQEVRLVGSTNISVIGNNNASTFSFISNNLTNQNLDNYKTLGFHHSGGSNTVTNKPSGIDAFGLLVYQTAGGWFTQEIIEANTNSGRRWQRYYNGSSWTAWIPLPTFTTTPTSGQIVITDGTTGGIKSSGYTIAKSVPSNADFTNTWRPIANNLTTNSSTTDNALSAYQGYLLATGSARDSTKLPTSGGTMIGVLKAYANQYTDNYTTCGIDMQNSDIVGLNSIYTSDVSDGAAEGIHFYRDTTHVDTFWMNGGHMYFVPNRALGTNTTAANSNEILHTGNVSTTIATDTGTSSITLAHGGKYKLTAGGKSVIFTMPNDNNTDTLVTQTNDTTTTTALPLLIANSTTSPETSTIRKVTNLTIIPSTGEVSLNGSILLTNVPAPITNWRGIRGTVGTNDYWRIGGAAASTTGNNGYMELATADDGNEPIYVRQYTGVFTTLKRTLTLLDVNGNTKIPGNLTGLNSLIKFTYNGTVPLDKEHLDTLVPVETKFEVSRFGIYLGIKKSNIDIRDNYLRMSHSHTYLHAGCILDLEANESTRINSRDITISSSGGYIDLKQSSIKIDSNMKTDIYGPYAHIGLGTGAYISGEGVQISTNDGWFSMSSGLYIKVGTSINICNGNSDASIHIGKNNAYLRSDKSVIRVIGDTIRLNTSRSLLRLSSDTKIETNKFRLYNTIEGHNVNNTQKLKFYIDTNLTSMAFGEKVLNRKFNGTTFTTTIATGQSSVAFGDNVIVSGTHSMGVGKGNNPSLLTYTPTTKSYNSSTRKWTLTFTAAQISAITNLYGTNSIFMVLVYVNGETMERQIKPCKARYSSSTTIELIGINNNSNSLGLYTIYDIINETAVSNLRVTVVSPTFLVRGNSSFATGESLLAYGDNQLVIGKWNAVENNGNLNGYGNKLFIIGYGTPSARKNVLTVSNTGQIQVQPNNNSWNKGRDSANLRQVTFNQYSPLLSMKTTNGSWELGTYTNDILHFSYILDTTYNGANGQDVDIQIKPDGTMWSKTNQFAFVGNNNHTHNYAGSTSAGGAANTAKLLDPVANSTTSSSASTWTNDSTTTKKVVWGQKFAHTDFSTDTGDITLWLSGNDAKTQTYLNMSIDGNVISSKGFIGPGSGITALNGSNISSGTVALARGGTGSGTAEGALTNLGLGLTTITKAITFTDAGTWYDTGISGTDIPTNGTYIVQVSGIASTGTSMWYEIWSGVMSWRAESTNSAATNEIPLHQAGHASNHHTIYLRTVRQSSSNMKLQIAANFSYTTATNVTFKFRKMI